MSSPTVVDGTVYFGSNDSNLYAVDAETGEQEWAFQTGAMVKTSPTVVGGVVYVGSNDSNLYALDSETGTQRWALQTGAMVKSSPTMAGDTVYFGSSDSAVYAVDATTGERKYTFQTEGAIESSPTVTDGTVYVGSDDAKLYAIDEEAGEQRWVFEAGLPVRGSPTVADDTVFVGSRDHHLYAVDAETGKQRGRFETDWHIAGSPTVMDGTVYISSIDSHLYAVDTDAGQQQWVLDTDFPVHSSPTVTDGMVYVGSNNSNLHAVDADTGEQQWAFRTDGRIDNSPTVVDGTVYVGCCDGTLYAIETGIADERSEGSRVMLGTLGHHDEWADRAIPPSSEVAVGESNTPNLGGEIIASTTRQSPDSGVTDDVADLLDDAVTRHSLSYADIEKRGELGRGGNADVFRATATTDHGSVDIALKQPRMGGGETLHTGVVERMMQEAETWQQLDDHDHIVGVVDYGSQPLPWIGMEYMNAGHLGQRAEAMSFEQKLWTAIATTEAVRHAHRRGVAHLDLKPENILFHSVENRWDAPKVADWGLSKHLLDHSKSVEGMSPQYAAPEQFDDEYGSTDDITDIYQLGAVFYELFTGRPPFEGQTFKVINKIQTETPAPPSRIADVPPALDEILLTALATEKGDRYESVLYLRDAFQQLRDDLDESGQL